jgi:chemotaxis-related protein WspB
MLFILFRLGEERYALEAAHVIEIIPRLPLRPQPGTPDFVAGLFNYRGTVVPVLDLGTLTLGVPCAEQLSTRIILIDYTLKSGVRKVLGLIAEAVTDTIKKEPCEFVAVATGQVPHLGKIALEGGNMVQGILPEYLLPPEVERFLFEESPPGESSKS